MHDNYELKKKSNLSIQFLKKYIYVISLGLILIFGASYSLTFFLQNSKIMAGIVNVSSVNVNSSNNSISASNLVASVDKNGMTLFSKSLTITNSSLNNGDVLVTLTRTSGLALADLRYGLFVNDVLMTVGNIPANGKIYESAILPGEQIDLELRLWPKQTYNGSVQTFEGTLDSSISHSGLYASDYIRGLSENDNKITKDGTTYTYASDSVNNYVKFNCDNTTCEEWRVVKIEDGRLVLTKSSDYNDASLRTNSEKYDMTLNYHDNTNLVYSHSTDKKNVYLIKTAKIIDGNGTQTNPFVLDYKIKGSQDEKVIATLTYDKGGTTYTQPIYGNRKNYVSQTVSNASFQGWTDETNTYQLGDVISVTSDTTLRIVSGSSTISDEFKNKAELVNYIMNYTTEFINKPATYPGYGTQDTVGENANKKDVYFFNGSSAATNGNLLFAGYCWQIVRTTDNGGVRLLYNGLAVDNKCEDSRSSKVSTWKAVNGADSWSAKSITTSYLYGTGFDYDLTSGTFSLVNPDSETKIWTYETYTDFIGKYTCQNITGTNCQKVYYVGEKSYNNNNQVYLEEYSIGGLTDYRQIGKSVFTPAQGSPGQVGYMFNVAPKANQGTIASDVHVGSDVRYENGAYTLIGVYEDSNNTTLATLDANHHYTCNTTSDTCATVRYYFYNNFYIELTNNATVESVLKSLINYKQAGDTEDANINIYDSAMKGYLENWYNKNLKAYESYIDTSAVYCNDRSIPSESGLAGWKKNGGALNQYLHFKQGIAIDKNLSCSNLTDRFSTNNTSARLSNPIGLLTEPERGLMTYNDDYSYASAPNWYWNLSPSYFYEVKAGVGRVVANGTSNYSYAIGTGAVRAAITLSPSAQISGGTGLKDDPYIVGPIVERNN